MKKGSGMRQLLAVLLAVWMQPVRWVWLRRRKKSRWQ